jgi:hypothetical protein
MSLYAADREGRCDFGCGWGWGKKGVGDVFQMEKNFRNRKLN